MTSRLELLPTELLDLVLDAVDDLSSQGDISGRYDRRVKTFSAISRSSKLLSHASRPYLYRSFESLGNGKGVRAFARSLCENPPLMDHVQIVNIIPSRAASPRPPTHQELLLFMRALRSLRPDDIHNDLVDALIQGCYNAEICVLLCLTTNIRILQISTYDHATPKDEKKCKDCPDMEIGLQAIFSPSRLAKLPSTCYWRLDYVFLFGKLFEVSEERQNRGTSPNAIQNLLQLPNLTSIDCSGIKAAIANSSTKWTAPKKSSNVLNLKLVYGNIDAGSVHRIMKTCNAVETLEIIWEALMPGGEDFEDRNYYLDVSVPTLRTALDRHHTTLETIELTNKIDRYTAWSGQPAIGTLQHFSSLKILKLDSALLVGPDSWEKFDPQLILPPSLQELIVHCDIGLKMLEAIIPAMSKFEGALFASFQATFPWQQEEDQDEWFDELLSRPKSEKIIDWCLETESHDDGRRLTFSCKHEDGLPIRASLQRLAGFVTDVEAAGLLFELYPDPNAQDDEEGELVEATESLAVEEGSDNA